jgi:hypothetical protein
LALIAAAALLTALTPLPSLALHLTAWVVFILVLVISAWMDRARSPNPAPRQRLPAANSVTSPEPLERPDPGTSFSLSLGPFNTQNGLDLDESPESICQPVAFEDRSVYSDDDGLWPGSHLDVFTSFPTSDPFESIHH